MLEKLNTESRNIKSMKLDELSIFEILQLMNEEDQNVPKAVARELNQIEKVIKETVKCLKNNGRLIYLGAGTSGRLGVLDAAECPPTFGVDSSLVVGLIAGGEKAFINAVEGAEDSVDFGMADLENIQLQKNDMVIGIAASGRTPYVIGGLKYARSIGASTASISCNKNSIISQYSDIVIEVDTKAEVLTGSTRLKAGTAQKNILNMISTVSMICMGKAYSNLMVDMLATNYKLEKRSIRMILEVLDITEEEASLLLKESNWNVKTAIFMGMTSLDKEASVTLLEQANGKLKVALDNYHKAYNK